MDRRSFFKLTAAGLALPVISNSLLADVLEESDDSNYFPLDAIYNQSTPLQIKDVFLEESLVKSFQGVRNKLTQVQRFVGYGNFNIISFDDVISIAKRAGNIQAFTKEELAFFEYIFYNDPTKHGFYGEKISGNLTDKIKPNEVVKIPRTGHYLFKDRAHGIYNEMIKDVGDTLFLTSGVRSVMKQTKLYLDKLHRSDNNISLTSKSIAPPAYTHHGRGDFDVGKKGFGHANFTSRFALTEEFIKMRTLKYIDMRYTVNNKDGVRYEPWHVKII